MFRAFLPSVFAPRTARISNAYSPCLCCPLSRFFNQSPMYRYKLVFFLHFRHEFCHYPSDLDSCGRIGWQLESTLFIPVLYRRVANFNLILTLYAHYSTHVHCRDHPCRRGYPFVLLFRNFYFPCYDISSSHSTFDSELEHYELDQHLPQRQLLNG